MFFDTSGPLLQDIFLSDPTFNEHSSPENLANFEIPSFDSDDDWQLRDLDIQCDAFVGNAADISKEDFNLAENSPVFDFEDLDESIIDVYLLEALNSDLSNDSPPSVIHSAGSNESLYVIDTHDYVATYGPGWNSKESTEGDIERVHAKVRSWGEPKFCAELGAFRCPVEDCGKLYAKASHVRAHLRRHSGEKPYRCTWEGCMWRFARSDELARHRRSHSGDKPYGCTECGKRFARSDHLSKHGRVHERRRRAAEASAAAATSAALSRQTTMRMTRTRKIS
ncbi:Krueppel-like factor 9 [Amyelois transitella]|uniref:Krueppel-like factor 9 n=1 Tax=Amyelois transitella TaxID=680683 RepID=UPI00067A7715|nr:Krueppel-like factor 9 [Amyelois transitella]